MSSGHLTPIKRYTEPFMGIVQCSLASEVSADEYKEVVRWRAAGIPDPGLAKVPLGLLARVRLKPHHCQAVSNHGQPSLKLEIDKWVGRLRREQQNQIDGQRVTEHSDTHTMFKVRYEARVCHHNTKEPVQRHRGEPIGLENERFMDSPTRGINE